MCLWFASLACQQAARPATPAAAQAEVGPDDPVITLDDFCIHPSQQGGACRTEITRSQFEKLAEALQPGMPLSLRLKVAESYARILRMSAAAEMRGLDKTPAFQEAMRYARMQLLSQDLGRALQADADNVKAAEIEDYYTRNQSSFEQATLSRIFIPRARQGATQSEAQAAADEQAMRNLCENLRARAAHGEDPDQLQRDAYAQAGLAPVDVDTKIENVRRAALPPAHERVLDLKPGEVSEVISDPAGARFIYVMISKRTLALDEVAAEVRTQISGRRYRDSMKGFEGGVVLSDAYFNPPQDTATPPTRILKAKKAQSPPALTPSPPP